MPSPNNNSKRKKRRWTVVSLRTVLIVVTLLCIILGRWVSRWQDQARIAEWLTEESCYFAYEPWYVNSSSDTPQDLTSTQRLKLWLADQLGPDAVVSVDYVRVDQQKQLDRVSRLNGIRDLDVWSSAGIDLSAASRLKDLECLTVTGRFGISVLGKLPNLLELRLSGVKDPTKHLGNFPKLKRLSLDKSIRISSLEFLNELDELEVLSIPDASGISSVAPLSNCKKLEELVLTRCPASDFSSIDQLRELTDVALANSRIKSLEPFRKLNRLQSLDVRDTDIDSLEPLSNLILLNDLRFQRTAVSDINPLRNLTRLSGDCLLYTSPSPRDQRGSRMPSSA